MKSAPASPATGRKPRPARMALTVVYFTVFLDLLGFGIILPFLPYYALELGASGVGLGVLLTSYSFAQLCGAAILGRLSDRHGRRPILLLSLAGASAGMVLSGLAQSLLFLCLARAVAGLFGGSIASAQAYIADVTESHNRARYMGMLGASIGLGFVVGPALGVGLDTLGLGFVGAAFLAAGLAAANLVAASFRLPESLPVEARISAAATPTHSGLDRWVTALRRPNLSQVLTATFLTTFAFVVMETTFALLGEQRFGLDERGFGLVLVMVGVVVIVVQGGLIGRLTRHFGVRPVATAGGVFMGTSLTLLPLAPSLGWTLAALALLAAGQGLTSPTLATLASQVSADDEQGTVLGTGQSLGAAARAVGPLLAGSLYDVHSGLPYLVGGVLALGAGVLIASIHQS